MRFAEKNAVSKREDAPGQQPFTDQGSGVGQQLNGGLALSMKIVWSAPKIFIDGLQDCVI